MIRYAIRLEQHRRLFENCFLLRFIRPAEFDVTPGQFYLCGGTAMIHDVIMIIDERFAGGPIFSEIFY